MGLKMVKERNPNLNSRAYWSVDGQVFYLDGSAWGLSKGLRTVYMGTEEEVLKRHPAK